MLLGYREKPQAFFARGPLAEVGCSAAYRREGWPMRIAAGSTPATGHRLRSLPEAKAWLVDEIERLRRRRWTGKQIAAETGVSPATVSRVLRQGLD